MPKRFLLALATLLAALAAHASTVEDRSPFRQGHWWDPTRSGHGFEILNAGENVFVVWYTYDASERPVWYTAQGTVGAMGSPWTLQKHRWGSGAIVESTSVGSLRLSRNHFESLTADWDLAGARGSWKIEPFVQSGIINEVDLSGHWYDPANSGWGMTLVDQGDVFGAVIYAYDPAGEPTWVAGFERGKGTSIAVHKASGACPSCAQRSITTEPAGGLDIAYLGDTEITVRGSLSIPLAAGLRVVGAQGRQLGRPASTRRVDHQLAPFRSERTLKDFIAAGMENRAYMSAGSDFSAMPPGAAPVSFSTTNTQEAGVDEADLVKTDGRYLYALTPLVYTSCCAPARKVRIVYLGEGGSTLTPVAEHTLPVTQGNYAYYAESGLYLHAGNLTVVSTGYYYGGWYYTPAPTAETVVEVLWVQNPSAPVARYRASLPGTMVSSRRIGDKLYVVTRFTPNVPGYINYAYNEAQRAANRELIAATPLTMMLPWIAENGGGRVVRVPLSKIYAPQLGGARPVADMVVVSVFDVREPRLVESMALVGRTETMYASNSAIYLASSRYDTRVATASYPLPVQKSLLNTDVHKIAIDGQMRLVGSGSVEGVVNGGWWGTADKAAFRFGEVGSRLGVVSSSTTGWWGSNSNRVTLLEPSTIAPGLLKTVSWLPNERRPQPLGKPGEALFGTRFVGNKLYAVTFRVIDPLYSIDLSDASDPRITGEVEVPGFSDYLHPLPNGLLLGFGRDNAIASGMQVSLYDVNGPAPREMQRLSIGKQGSDSPIFRSHHALSVLRRADGTTVLGLPASVYESAYGWSYSGLLRFELRGTTASDARLVHTHTLKTAVAGSANPYPSSSAESSWGYGRSVLFPDAAIYAADKLWRQDARGIVDGPY